MPPGIGICPGCNLRRPRPCRLVCARFCEPCAGALTGRALGERHQDGTVSLRRNGPREPGTVYWVGPRGTSLHRGRCFGTVLRDTGRAYRIIRPERVHISRNEISVVVR